MAFRLPSEFRAPADQEVYSDFDESKYQEILAQLTVVQQAIFDKPVKHRHLKALYMKGLVDGKAQEQDVGGRRCFCQSYALHYFS